MMLRRLHHRVETACGINGLPYLSAGVLLMSNQKSPTQSVLLGNYKDKLSEDNVLITA